jgi:hypothetical protein
MSDLPTASENQAAADAAVQREATRRSRRAFILGGAATLAGLSGWRWLVSRPPVDGVPAPLRRVLDANGQLAEAYFSSARLAPVFPVAQARMPRVNGKVGLKDPLDAGAWRLLVQPYSPDAPPLSLTLADIQGLPRVEMTTELKCIEGWSIVVSWAGARFADFVARYVPQAAAAPYVSLTTPDGRYYVGLDQPSALHPQTLLCYELNGQPLTEAHGAPLRLVVPVKYGIKYLKRLGRISFPDQRPADYWAARGYDWHAGH